MDRDVERGRRFVGDQELRVAGERHRDHHPLAEAARELVRVRVEPLLGSRHADQAEHLERALIRLFLRDVAVQQHDLGDLASDLPGRVERRHRVLEDHRDLVAPDRRHLLLAEVGDVTAVEGDDAFRHVTDSRQELHDRKSRRRLSASGFADEPDALARVDVERDPRDRLHVRGAQVELGVEVLDFEDGHPRSELRRRRCHQPTPPSPVAPSVRAWPRRGTGDSARSAATTRPEPLAAASGYRTWSERILPTESHPSSRKHQVA